MKYFRQESIKTSKMGLEEDFQAAQDLVSNKINKTLSNEELLEVYALFKQGSIGDCNTSRPGMMDFKVELTNFTNNTIQLKFTRARLNGTHGMVRKG